MSFPINLTEVENFITNLMPQACTIANRYFGSRTLIIKEKTATEVVTEADLAVNEFLSSRLRLEYPDIPILSEESPKKEKDWYLKKELYWVIDPIDGTHNFARGSKDFTISLALCSYEKSLFGSIMAPRLGESFIARVDQEGVKTIGSMTRPVVYVDFGYEKESRELATRFIQSSIRYTSDIISLGCASLAICHIATGLGSVYSNFAIKPWDQAAAGLFAQKSGVILEDLNEIIWTPFSTRVLLYHPSQKKISHQIIKRI